MCGDRLYSARQDNAVQKGQYTQVVPRHQPVEPQAAATASSSRPIAATALSRPPRSLIEDILMTSFDFNPAITAGETERVASASAACSAIKEQRGNL
jgi:hypothetical protein